MYYASIIACTYHAIVNISLLCKLQCAEESNKERRILPELVYQQSDGEDMCCVGEGVGYR